MERRTGEERVVQEDSPNGTWGKGTAQREWKEELRARGQLKMLKNWKGAEKLFKKVKNETVVYPKGLKNGSVLLFSHFFFSNCSHAPAFLATNPLIPDIKVPTLPSALLSRTFGFQFPFKRFFHVASSINYAPIQFKSRNSRPKVTKN